MVLTSSDQACKKAAFQFLHNYNLKAENNPIKSKVLNIFQIFLVYETGKIRLSNIVK